MLEALGRRPLFIAAALPLKIFPPLFNSYAGGRGVRAFTSTMRCASSAAASSALRSDLSATLFLADPDSYEGGELLVEGQFGAQ